jgi:hydroxymethylpyrimidine/phosphomethylpyrimidine kinase
MLTALTIAGFDPSSGAGVSADLMVFAAHGLFGTACITSLTVQSTVGVLSTHPVQPSVIRDTLACLEEDLPAAGIKIGMLGTAEAVAAVADFIEAIRNKGSRAPIVLDPVLRSSSGRELIDAEGARLLRSRLFPLVDWITPNLDELAFLTAHPVADRGQLATQAAVLQQAIGSDRVTILAKGGHLEPPDDLLLTADGDQQWLAGDRIESTSTHGTGCALSSALLSRLILGDAPLAAARRAKEYVAEAMRSAVPRGHGAGPMNHLWPLR